MTDTKAETKTKRNEGPVIVTFSDGAKADYKRVPKGVTSVIIKDRKGNERSFDLASIPTEHLAAMAAFAFAGRAKTFINNHAEGDAPDVVGMADKIFGDIVAGNMYAKAETTGTGKPRGRQFDPTDYVEAFKRAKETQAKAGVKNKQGVKIEPATEAQLENFKMQLVAMTGPDRTKKIKDMMGNPVFLKHYRAVQSAKVNTKGIDVSIDDMDF